MDVGGTKIRAARVVDGRVVEETFRATPPDDPTMVMGAITDAAAGVHDGRCPIGVGTAGQVDRHHGVVLTSPNLPGRNVPLGAALEEAFSVPVVVDNDVRLAAVGEWLALGGEPEVLVALYVGTGVGAGVVLRGRPLAGVNNLAAEAGHATFRPGGELCGCGRRGCFEAYAGGRSVLERLARRIGSGREAPVHVGGVVELAERGVPAAREVWEEAVEAIRTLAWNLVVLYDPAALVLGGGVVRGVPELAGTVREHVAAQVWSGFPPPRVVVGSPDAAVTGAAYTAWKEHERG